MKKNHSGDYVAPEINVTQCSVEQGIAASYSINDIVIFEENLDEL